MVWLNLPRQLCGKYAQGIQTGARWSAVSSGMQHPNLFSKYCPLSLFDLNLEIHLVAIFLGHKYIKC